MGHAHRCAQAVGRATLTRIRAVADTDQVAGAAAEGQRGVFIDCLPRRNGVHRRIIHRRHRSTKCHRAAGPVLRAADQTREIAAGRCAHGGIRQAGCQVVRCTVEIQRRGKAQFVGGRQQHGCRVGYRCSNGSPVATVVRGILPRTLRRCRCIANNGDAAEAADGAAAACHRGARSCAIQLVIGLIAEAGTKQITYCIAGIGTGDHILGNSWKCLCTAAAHRWRIVHAGDGCSHRHGIGRPRTGGACETANGAQILELPHHSTGTGRQRLAVVRQAHR